MPAKISKRPGWPSLKETAHLAWCLLGVSCGLAVALSLSGPPATPFLLASVGGSAIFLFGLTSTPAAQPRALFGGHLGGAIIGIACYQLLGETLSAYVLALVLTFGFMLLARMVHPPAGANPLLMISAHAGWSALWQPVLLGVGSLALIAVVWSRLFPGLAHYPVNPVTPSSPQFFPDQCSRGASRSMTPPETIKKGKQHEQH